MVRVLARAPRARRPVLGADCSCSAALDRAEVPVLLLTGWQDLFLDQTLAQYAHLRRRDVPVAVTIGSWTHAHMLTKGAPTVLRESLALARHAPGGQPRRRRAARCASTSTTTAGSTSTTGRPRCPSRCGICNRAAASAMRCRPTPRRRRRSPTTPPTRRRPSAVGCCPPTGGYRNDTKLADRADVLTFTGDALSQDLYVVGTPVVELSHSCDNPHNDLFVRVSEVDAKGRSRNVSDGYRRGTSDSGTIAHRTGRRRAPLPRGLTHPGAGCRRIASAVRPQPRHRRAADHRQTDAAGHAHRAPRGRRVAAAAARRAPGRQPTESRTRVGDVAQRRVVVHRRRPHRIDRQRHPARAPGVFGHAAQPFRLGQRADLDHQHRQPVPGPEVQPVGAHRLGGPDMQSARSRRALRAG